MDWTTKHPQVLHKEFIQQRACGVTAGHEDRIRLPSVNSTSRLVRQLLLGQDGMCSILGCRDDSLLGSQSAE